MERFQILKACLSKIPILFFNWQGKYSPLGNALIRVVHLVESSVRDWRSFSFSHCCHRGSAIRWEASSASESRGLTAPLWGGPLPARLLFLSYVLALNFSSIKRIFSSSFFQKLHQHDHLFMTLLYLIFHSDFLPPLARDNSFSRSKGTLRLYSWITMKRTV